MLTRRLLPFKPPKAKFVSPKRCTFEPTVSRRFFDFSGFLQVLGLRSVSCTHSLATLGRAGDRSARACRPAGLSVCLGLLALSCGEPPKRSLVEDQTRRVAP